MNVALIDYSMGNLGSVSKALKFIGANLEVIDRPGDLRKFNCAILPGVGNFGEGMEHLRSAGFAAAIRDFLKTPTNRMLGICLGMQMLLEASDEAPGESGLGFFPGSVKRFPAGTEKVPQMGWNQLEYTGNIKLFSGISSGSFFYFVHSFYVPVLPELTLGTTQYILPFSSVIGRNNLFGVQFHPEKSQEAGLRLLKNFLQMGK